MEQAPAAAEARFLLLIDETPGEHEIAAFGLCVRHFLSSRLATRSRVVTSSNCTMPPCVNNILSPLPLRCIQLPISLSWSQFEAILPWSDPCPARPPESANIINCTNSKIEPDSAESSHFLSDNGAANQHLCEIFLAFC